MLKASQLRSISSWPWRSSENFSERLSFSPWGKAFLILVRTLMRMKSQPAHCIQGSWWSECTELTLMPLMKYIGRQALVCPSQGGITPKKLTCMIGDESGIYVFFQLQRKIFMSPQISSPSSLSHLSLFFSWCCCFSSWCKYPLPIDPTFQYSFTGDWLYSQHILFGDLIRLDI